MSDSLRDGLKTLVEFWRAKAHDTGCDLGDYYRECASEAEALLEQTAEATVPPEFMLPNNFAATPPRTIYGYASAITTTFKGDTGPKAVSEWLNAATEAQPEPLPLDMRVKLVKARLRDSLAELGIVLDGIRIFSDDPFPASTEEPTVDSAGWVELEDSPGELMPASYSAADGVYEFGANVWCGHGAIARHWLIPKPTAEGATHDQV